MVLGLRCSVGRRQKSDRDQYSQWGVNGTKLAIFSMLPWYTVQGRRRVFEFFWGGGGTKLRFIYENIFVLMIILLKLGGDNEPRVPISSDAPTEVVSLDEK